MVQIEVARRVAAPLPDAVIRRVIRKTLRAGGSDSEHSLTLSIAFVGPKRMRELNRTYRHQNRATDTLAFPFRSSFRGRERARNQLLGSEPFEAGEAMSRNETAEHRAEREISHIGTMSRCELPRGVRPVPAQNAWFGARDDERMKFGELVICPSYVKQQARRIGEPFRRELTRVLVHGALHLLGHDHVKPRSAERMFALQEAIVRRTR